MSWMLFLQIMMLLIGVMLAISFLMYDHASNKVKLMKEKHNLDKTYQRYLKELGR